LNMILFPVFGDPTKIILFEICVLCCSAVWLLVCCDFFLIDNIWFNIIVRFS
jgi:hypothetical protein